MLYKKKGYSLNDYYFFILHMLNPSTFKNFFTYSNTYLDRSFSKIKFSHILNPLSGEKKTKIVVNLFSKLESFVYI